MARDDSRCKKRTYCDFERSRDLSDALIEICLGCGKKVTYFKDEQGNIDNAKYLRDHIRHTVQPYGRTARLFYEIYGADVYHTARKRMEGIKSKERMKQEWGEMRQDLRSRAKKTTL